MSAHKGKFISYHRVSTDKQGKSGLGLDAQRVAVADYLDGGEWELVGEFTEVESGKRSDRPELVKDLAACKRHKATLVIARLDRLARNVHFISGLMEAKVKFVACDSLRRRHSCCTFTPLSLNKRRGQFPHAPRLLYRQQNSVASG
jgi:DNA invertase Pin-like site-specific DNA recombinase